MRRRIRVSDNRPLSFQNLILTLHDYWSKQGCVILQPYDMRVGAGTFHPATTLRSLGPDKWNCAYVQPSRRPTDGRSGENRSEERSVGKECVSRFRSRGWRY